MWLVVLLVIGFLVAVALVVGACFLGLVAVGILSQTRAQQARQQEQLAHVASSLGLALHPGGLLGGPVLRGERGGVAVRVEYGSRDEGGVHLPCTRFFAGGVAAGLRFEGEGLGVLSVLFGEDHRTGDDPFDPAVRVQGEPALVRALLDEGTRSVLRRVIVAHKVVVADGEVALERPEHVLEPEVVASLIDEVAGLARRLADPGTAAVVEKLVHNVRADPAPLVRFACLRMLDADHPGSAATAAAEAAVHDADDRVRLLAARIRGDTAPFRAAPVEALRAYAPHDPDGLTRTLVTLGDPAPLLALLDIADTRVRVLALRGLAQIGTPDQVLTIQPLSKGMFAHEAVKVAARAAVEGIQARVGPAAGGRLALADDAAGAVSLAADPGRVALVEPPGRERA